MAGSIVSTFDPQSRMARSAAVRLGTVANVDSLAVSLPANRVYATADGRTYAWELIER